MLDLPAGYGACPRSRFAQSPRLYYLKKQHTADRPLVAVVGLNDATETTDYLMPAGILRRADVADVVMLSQKSGPVRLFPALKVEADATIATFDAAHPDGAD